MTQIPSEITEQKIDHAIRIFSIIRICIVIGFALLGPFLYFSKIISEDMIIVASIVLAILAVLDWYAIGRVIQRMKKAKEQIEQNGKD